MQDVQPFGVRSHQRVLDAVVHHLHEMAAPRGAAVQIAELLGGRFAAPTGGALDGAEPGREGPEDRIEARDDIVGATDHHAEPAVEPPYAAAGAAVDVVDALGSERGGARDVVGVPRIAAVDDRVARFEQRCQLVDDQTGHARGHHQPDRPRRVELRDQLLQGRRPGCSLGDERVDRRLPVVVDDAFDAGTHAAANEVRSHAAQADHAELHFDS